MKKLNQTGIATVAMVAIVALVAIVGMGWYVYNNSNSDEVVDTSVGRKDLDQTSVNSFACGSVSFDLPEGWYGEDSKNSDLGLSGTCQMSSVAIDTLPGDLRAITEDVALVLVDVEDLDGELADYVDSRFSSEGEGLGGYDNVQKTEFSFGNGRSGYKVTWESERPGVTYLYRFEPGTDGAAGHDFAQPAQVVVIEAIPGNTALLSQVETMIRSIKH